MTNFLRFAFLVTLIVPACLASGCTYPTKINDRLSYAMEKQFVEKYQATPPISFEIDKATKGFEFTGTASGFIGAAAYRKFPIGWTFAAYLDQAEKAALRSDKGVPIIVGVHLSDCQLKYSNSGFGTGVDWVNISLMIDTTFPGESAPRKLSLHREVNLPMEETSLTGENDRALVRAMEGLVSDYIGQVVGAWETIVRRK
jgi:hypothetical protein